MEVLWFLLVVILVSEWRFVPKSVGTNESFVTVPATQKNHSNHGFKTCGWLTKSSASDVKYCHLTAFGEICVNQIGSLDFSKVCKWKLILLPATGSERPGPECILSWTQPSEIETEVHWWEKCLALVCSASLGWINTWLAVHHCQGNCHFSRALH